MSSVQPTPPRCRCAPTAIRWHAQALVRAQDEKLVQYLTAAHFAAARIEDRAVGEGLTETLAGTASAPVALAR